MGDKQLLRTIEIVNYPKEVMTAKSIRSKYWEPKHKLLMAFFSNAGTTPSLQPILKTPTGGEIHVGQDRHGRFWVLNSGYLWKKVGPRYRLWNTYSKEYVVRNEREAGTERWKPINGQDMYSQAIDEFTRAKIVKYLKEFWYEQFVLWALKLPSPTSSLEGYNYPVTIDIHYHARIPDNADLDNYSLPYHKTLIDSLVSFKLIRGDTVRDINGINLSHTPIEEGSMDDLVKSWGKSANDVITIKIYGNANKL